MTIFDYYARNDRSLDKFFSSFFGNGSCSSRSRSNAGGVMMSAASPSCWNVYLLHLHHPSPPSHCPVTAPLTSSEVLHLWIPKMSSFGNCAAVVGIFNGVED